MKKLLKASLALSIYAAILLLFFLGLDLESTMNSRYLWTTVVALVAVFPLAMYLRELEGQRR